jgi:hypothetical protein
LAEDLVYNVSKFAEASGEPSAGVKGKKDQDSWKTQ